MTVSYVIHVSPLDVAILVAGLLASWVMVWFWATSERERNPWDLGLLVLAIAAGFALGWWTCGHV